MSDRFPVVARLRSVSKRANAARPAGAEPNLDTLVDGYREVTLADPRVLAGILPEVAKILERHSLVCSDCPHLERGPRALTFEAIEPYLAAFVWPVAIRPDGSVRLNICVGSNGLDRFEEVDEDLAEAAVISLLHNREAMALIGPHVQSAMASSAYQSTEDDVERLEIVRHRLAHCNPTRGSSFAAWALAASRNSSSLVRRSARGIPSEHLRPSKCCHGLTGGCLSGTIPLFQSIHVGCSS